jgi:hypothetical protein
MRFWTYVLDVSGIDWNNVNSAHRLSSAIQSIIGEIEDERAVANLNACVEEFNNATTEEDYGEALNSLVNTCDSFGIWIKD